MQTLSGLATIGAGGFAGVRTDEGRWRKHGLGKRDSDQARAKQDKTGNGHSQETVRSEFITHSTPPIVRPCSKGTAAPSHSQKDSLPTSNLDPG
jgi:hypothetical protein